jgi:hypothetical protein
MQTDGQGSLKVDASDTKSFLRAHDFQKSECPLCGMSLLDLTGKICYHMLLNRVSSELLLY